MLVAGVPCVPGYHGDNQDPEYLLSRAKEIGIQSAAHIGQEIADINQVFLSSLKPFMVAEVKVSVTTGLFRVSA
jgi:hypothetical protein